MGRLIVFAWFFLLPVLAGVAPPGGGGPPPSSGSSCSGSLLVSALCTAFVPTRGLAERLSEVSSYASDRFPWSVLSSLQAPGLSEASPDLSGEWLPGVYVRSGPLTQVFTLVRSAMSVVLWLSVWWFILDRVVPRLRL